MFRLIESGNEREQGMGYGMGHKADLSIESEDREIFFAAQTYAGYFVYTCKLSRSEEFETLLAEGIFTIRRDVVRV